MTVFSHSTAYRPDYFTYIPAGHNQHFSTETPLFSPTLSVGCETPSDPNNPLLAHRLSDSPNSSSATVKMSGNLLQLQTNAAHRSSTSARPSARPTQNVLHVTSDDDSSSSSDSSSSDAHGSSCAHARCSRCQRTPSVDVRTGHWNMIQYGLNLWYCSRCASMVGMTQR